ncbi:prefoldin subunit 6-like isoform X2 [Cucurbita maxima]|uniref:Prefoldin subunit 6-like isoform X2 n=1 Tax=Cucurbita maxima TaxID=3661 RepID=A0A6J1KNW9_CUCMA|nr:prefoldin subunit 6-like isoform X2 [Cucurbita maxima]
MYESKFHVVNDLSGRLKYDTGLGESKFVLQELDLLKEDSIVYKLFGPILVRQDPAEPNANVRKRVGYLTAERSALMQLSGTWERSKLSKESSELVLDKRQ